VSDVAVIGGGIAGCATAALLAEAGASVTLYEREAIAAGASGRNSGILQHPMDPVLAPLYEASLALYGDLDGFELPEPSGVLVVSGDPSLAAAHEEVAARFPELEPTWLEGDDLRAAEPALAPDLYAYRVDAGRPIGPTAATSAGPRGRRPPVRGSWSGRRRPTRAAASSSAVSCTPPARSSPRPARGLPTRSAGERHGCGRTGASWRRCAWIARRGTRSSRPASRR
jgi:phytoene dehydrogenase-like protein